MHVAILLRMCLWTLITSWILYEKSDKSYESRMSTAFRSLINKLVDKGAKAAELKTRIEKELKSRDEVDKAASLLSEMRLGQLNALEWTGSCNPGLRTKSYSLQDNNYECEETDPLKIIVSHCGVTAGKKQIRYSPYCMESLIPICYLFFDAWFSLNRVINPDESLIKPDDLIDSLADSKPVGEANGSSVSKAADETRLSENSGKEVQGLVRKPVSPGKLSSAKLPGEPEPYAHFICEHFGHKEGRERFKPNKPLKPFSGEFPFKPPGRVSTKPKIWEETNVTPPLAVHGDTKLISLEESIEIQRTQIQKLRVTLYFLKISWKLKFLWHIWLQF